MRIPSRRGVRIWHLRTTAMVDKVDIQGERVVKGFFFFQMIFEQLMWNDSMFGQSALCESTPTSEAQPFSLAALPGIQKVTGPLVRDRRKRFEHSPRQMGC